MGEIVQESAIVVGLLFVSFAGPFAAIGFLVVRKRRARARRRSPIGIDLLRGPGHTLREQLDEAGIDVLGDVFLLSFVPLMALALFLAQSQLRGLQPMTNLWPIYAILVLCFVAVMLRRLWKAGGRADADPGPLRRTGRAEALGRRGIQLPHKRPEPSLGSR